MSFKTVYSQSKWINFLRIRKYTCRLNCVFNLDSRIYGKIGRKNIYQFDI